jgi:regulator of sigma E protease
MLDAALDQRSVQVTVRGENGRERLLWLDLNNTTALLEKGGLLKNLGITPWRPAVPAVVGRLVTGGAAERAGLQPGDRILEADGIVIADWEQWVDFVRSRPEHDISLEVERGGRTIHLQLRPDRIEEDGEAVGRIGTFVATPDKHLNDHMRTTVRYGVFDALEASLGKTWDMTTLTLRTLWKMVRGQASVENLSGPISIARYAGQSAMVGLTAFLGFMALVSVSLGVLNLLPVPVLDGGHLLYYLIEFFKGSPVSETTQQIGQQIGIALLICLMALAFYNDIARLTG